MRHDPDVRPRFWFLTPLLVAVLVATAVSSSLARAEAAPSAQPDSIGADHLIQPEDLAGRLALPAARRPELLHVGFKVLYRSGHISGSRFIGPGSKAEGLSALRQVLRRLPRQRAIVLYCGCCPWRDCPNVLPAFRTAQKMGFKDVRVLFLARNLQHDWIDQGLPFSEGE